MKKEIKYGFAWTSLLWTFLILGAVAVAAMWISFTVDSPVNLFGMQIESTSASFGILVIGGFFAVGAGVTVSLMFQQRGMSPNIVIKNKSMLIPLMGKGEIEILFNEIERWRINEQKTRKKLLVIYENQTYTIESRLMSAEDDFDVMVKWLRRKAAKKEIVAS